MVYYYRLDQSTNAVEVFTVGRPWRVQFPGAIHHVTAHAVSGQDMFLVDGDRHKFLSLLTDVHQRWGLSFHGYCLMSNHYHLEIETPDGALSAPMKSLNYRYASYLNQRLDRRGHLFDGRFKNVVVDADTYLHQLSRYIHLNPVRAGIVSRPADYRWSSYRAFIGDVEPPLWLVTELTLARFGNTEQQQRQGYRDFIDACDEDPQNPLAHAVHGSILGSRQFTEAILGALSADPAEPRIPVFDGVPMSTCLNAVCQAVAIEYGVSADVITRKGLCGVEPRQIAIYIGARCCGHRMADVGSYFGGVGRSAVHEMCNRIEHRIAGQPQLAEKIEHLLALTGRSIPPA